MPVRAVGCLAVALALVLCACTGSSSRPPVSEGGADLPDEVDISPERYLALREALGKLNELVDLVNAADSEVDEINQAIAGGFGDPETFFARFDKAEKAWDDVLDYLEQFTKEEESEIPSLRPGIEALVEAAAAWQLWAISYKEYLLSTLEAGFVDPNEGKRIERGSKLASEYEEEGMKLIGRAQDQVTQWLCEIEDYSDYVSGEDHEVDC
jgi:hypothetical protein